MGEVQSLACDSCRCDRNSQVRFDGKLQPYTAHEGYDATCSASRSFLANAATGNAGAMMPMPVPLDLSPPDAYEEEEETFDMSLQKDSADQDIGIEVVFNVRGLEVEAIFRGGLMDLANVKRADENLPFIQVGDLITAVNGMSGDMDLVAAEVKKSTALLLEVLRPRGVKRLPCPEATERLGQQPAPACSAPTREEPPSMPASRALPAS